MKFDYQFERKDFEQYLKDSNKKYHWICLIIFTVFYFCTCFDLIAKNAVALLISYIISVLVLFSILKLVSTIFVKFLVKRNDKIMELAYGTYKIELTDTAIKEKIDDKLYELKYEDIGYVTKNKNYLIIYPKNEKIMYLFIKKLFTKEETYNKCVEMIMSKYESDKEEVQETVIAPILVEEELKTEKVEKETKKVEEKKKTITKKTTSKTDTKKKSTSKTNAKSTSGKKTTTKKAK